MSKLAGEEAFGEGEGFVVALERRLAHGRRDERLPLPLADQFGHLGGAPAFKGEHAQIGKRH